MINKSHGDISLDIPSLPDTEYFLTYQDTYHFKFSAEGEQSKLNMVNGFGKWAKEDPANLQDILTVSSISYGNTVIKSEMVNPDFIKVKRTGLFGNRLKVIFQK